MKPNSSPKEHAPADPSVILDKLSRLRIETWSYKWEPGVRHIGPMAQDFAALFGVGDDPRHIQLGDTIGIAYAGIKGLHDILRRNEASIAELRRSLKSINREIRRLETKRRTPRRA